MGNLSALDDSEKLLIRVQPSPGSFAAARFAAPTSLVEKIPDILPERPRPANADSWRQRKRTVPDDPRQLIASSVHEKLLASPRSKSEPPTTLLLPSSRKPERLLLAGVDTEPNAVRPCR